LLIHHGRFGGAATTRIAAREPAAARLWRFCTFAIAIPDLLVGV